MALQKLTAFRKIILAILAIIILAAAQFHSISAPKSAQGADLSQFNAGNIISDSVFFNGSSLTEPQVQSFLNSKVPNCTINNGQPSHAAGAAWYSTTIADVCLKDYFQSTPSMAAQPGFCSAYSGSARESAASIIVRVGQACGISQKTLLVLLEKEQSLVTDSWPTVRQYDSATGFDCYDNGQPCVKTFAGFFYQVWAAARQFQRYGNYPFTWYPVGSPSAIRYQDPTVESRLGINCGAATVTIQNRATAALYYYTPYVPNSASLAAGYGSGDACSAYGNRNFFQLFVDWFGTTRAGQLTLTPTPVINGGFTSTVGSQLTVNTGGWDTGVQLAFQWIRDGAQIAGAQGSTYVTTASDIGTKIQVEVTGNKAEFDPVTRSSTNAVFIGQDLPDGQSSSLFNSVKPARLADTRPGFQTVDGQYAGNGRIGPGQTLQVRILGRNGLPTTGVSAVSLNVTAVNPSGNSFLTVYPTGTGLPNSSNLNFTAGQTIPNAVITKVGADGTISIFNRWGDTDIIVDLNGWFPTGSNFTPTNPARLADTRPGFQTVDGQYAGIGQINGGQVLKIAVLGRNGIPSTGVAAVALNLTVVNPSTSGYLTAFPSNFTIPNSSNLNFGSGQTVPNTVISKVGNDGTVSIYNPYAGLNLIVDINGWFSSN